MTLPEIPDVPLELKGHASSVLTVDFVRDSHKLAAGAKDGTVRIWSLQGADCADEPVVLHAHKGVVRALDFDESGLYIATGGDYSDPAIRLWDIANPEKELLTLHGHDDAVIDIALRTDIGRLASVSSAGIVRLWDLGGSEPSAQPIIFPREAVSATEEWGARTVTFSPDGRWLVTASGPDGKAELWRVSNDSLVNVARRTAGRSLTEEERLRYLGDENYQ
jgi:WD40 repeat protein